MVAPEQITRHHEWDDRAGHDIWVGGRPESEPVVIVEYDPHWSATHEAVAARVRTAHGLL